MGPNGTPPPTRIAYLLVPGREVGFSLGRLGRCGRRCLSSLVAELGQRWIGDVLRPIALGGNGNLKSVLEGLPRKAA
jgi:hypothetical protein